MLKAYHSRKLSSAAVKQTTVPGAICERITPSCGDTDVDEDGVMLRNAVQQSARLTNSVLLKDLSKHLCNLSSGQKRDIIRLVKDFPQLFNDVPT